jgi:hypothetical protein
MEKISCYDNTPFNHIQSVADLEGGPPPLLAKEGPNYGSKIPNLVPKGSFPDPRPPF